MTQDVRIIRVATQGPAGPAGAQGEPGAISSVAGLSQATITAAELKAALALAAAVTGPASAGDGHLALFDGATGTLIRDGGAASAAGLAMLAAADAAAQAALWSSLSPAFAGLTLSGGALASGATSLDITIGGTSDLNFNVAKANGWYSPRYFYLDNLRCMGLVGFGRGTSSYALLDSSVADVLNLLGSNISSPVARLVFGPSSPSNPALKPNGAGIDFVLGDDTGAAAITAGDAVFSGAKVLMSGLPTSDPHTAGQLWNNSGVLTVSAG